jgi:exosome complex component RRP43
MATTAQAAVDADAFKKLYPENFYGQFLERSTRPDGRPLGRARPTRWVWPVCFTPKRV